MDYILTLPMKKLRLRDGKQLDDLTNCGIKFRTRST